jgi:NAD(P)-dependent dehydrogenase (short-subunit alcohol dehydrogenase family)
MHEQHLHGKVALVTGATSGIGRVTAREIAHSGAEVWLLGRNRQRLDEVSREIDTLPRAPQPKTLVCDLASLDDVRQAAASFLASGSPLHILVNNAGVVNQHRRESKDGIEETFAVNHLASFLLTHLLLPRLKESAPSRIVNVSSNAHRFQALDLGDLQHEKSYSPMKVYSRSKLANVYFTHELARRLEGKGTGVTVNALNPGPVATGLASNNPGLLAWMTQRVMQYTFPSAERGARTSVYLACDAAVEGKSGGYYQRSRLSAAHPRTFDESIARRLWDISAELTGIDA